MADSVGKLTKAANAFAFDLYGKVCAEAGDGKNVFLSPISLTTALSMVFAGARGNTAQEMKQTLKFTEFSDQDLHSSFEDFQNTLSGNKEAINYSLNIANKLYAQKDYNILQEYTDITKKHYRAEAESCDFVGAAEAARTSINQWVESQTANKIKELIKPGIIDNLTRMILVNAIYFKGNWLDKFNAEHTKKSKFYINENDTVEVDMMFKNEKFNLGYDKALGLQVLEIPYVDNHLSMFVLLPQKRTGLAEVEANLTEEKLQEITSQMHNTKVMLHLPRFKLEHEFSANDMLSALGMKDVFTDSADLSGITGDKQLSVSAVVHKAFVEVNEEGTEAAAATAAVMMARCMPPQFRCDHPFIFTIRDNRSNALLFVGRVKNPAA